ncbi:MAG: hypothetical protein JWO15_1703 [Sphingomonadales bacterium]|nr:hypothetical protein [Sphingomonadales bacterium]
MPGTTITAMADTAITITETTAIRVITIATMIGGGAVVTAGVMIDAVGRNGIITAKCEYVADQSRVEFRLSLKANKPL